MIAMHEWQARAAWVKAQRGCVKAGEMAAEFGLTRCGVYHVRYRLIELGLIEPTDWPLRREHEVPMDGLLTAMMRAGATRAHIAGAFRLSEYQADRVMREWRVEQARLSRLSA